MIIEMFIFRNCYLLSRHFETHVILHAFGICRNVSIYIIMKVKSRYRIGAHQHLPLPSLTVEIKRLNRQLVPKQTRT